MQFEQQRQILTKIRDIHRRRVIGLIDFSRLHDEVELRVSPAQCESLSGLHDHVDLTCIDAARNLSLGQPFLFMPFLFLFSFPPPFLSWEFGVEL